MCVCVCVSLFTVSAFCTVTVNPRVPTAREVGTPPRGHCRGVTQHRLLESLGTGVTLIPYGPAGDERIPTDPGGTERIPTDPRGTERIPTDPGGTERVAVDPGTPGSSITGPGTPGGCHLNPHPLSPEEPMLG